MIPDTPKVPAPERRYLIDRLHDRGLPESEALFDAGIRHAEYLADATDEELLAVKGIGPAALGKLREIVPAREG